MFNVSYNDSFNMYNISKNIYRLGVKKMNENVKKVFDYLDEAKRIYFNIAVIMANNTDINWNDIFYKSRKNMTLLLTEGEIEDIRHIAGMLSKPRTTLDETLKKYKEK